MKQTQMFQISDKDIEKFEPTAEREFSGRKINVLASSVDVCIDNKKTKRHGCDVEINNFDNTEPVTLNIKAKEVEENTDIDILLIPEGEIIVSLSDRIKMNNKICGRSCTSKVKVVNGIIKIS